MEMDWNLALKNRLNRLQKLIELHAPQVIINNEEKLVNIALSKIKETGAAKDASFPPKETL